MCETPHKSHKRKYEVIKMKKLIALLLATVMCLSLVACGEDTPGETVADPNQNVQSGNEDPNATQDDNTNDDTANDNDASDDAAPGITLSDDLADFTVSIDGTVYQFPCSVQTFLDDGWQIVQKQVLAEDYLVEPGKTANTSAYRKSDSETIFLQIYNPGQKACKFSECTVFGVQLDALNNVPVEFSGGLKLGDAITTQEMLSIDERIYAQDNGVVRFVISGKVYNFHIEDGIFTCCIIDTYR